jgi:hypothetical protein
VATVLTATAQPTYGRVALQLTFTTVTLATISRIHPDGTVWPLRDANPVGVLSTTGVGAVVFDHELPLDLAVTYKASSTQTGTTFSSSAVTVASDPGDGRSRAWLTHPLKPALSALVTVADIGERARPARIGILPIIGRADPIAVTDLRLSGGGDLSLFTTTLGEAATVRALLADGGVVMLRAPAIWHNNWFYAALGDASETGPGGWDPIREWRMAYTAVAAPAGIAQGAVGSTYADAAAAYATYTLAAAGEPTYADAAFKPGP